MTTNLNFDTIAQNQDQKFQTSNDADGQVDAALTETYVITIDNTNAGTVAEVDLQRAAIVQVDENGGTPPTGDITLTFESFKRGIFVVYNNTQHPVFCSISGQSLAAVEVPPATSFTLTMDASNVQEAGAPSTTKDLEFSLPVSPVPAATLADYKIVTESLVLKVGLPGAQAWVFNTDPGAQVYQIQVNEVLVGNVNFAGGAQVGTFTFAVETKMAAGDRMSIISPVAPGTQAFFTCTIPATRR